VFVDNGDGLLALCPWFVPSFSLTMSITSCLLATTGHRRKKKHKLSKSQPSADLDQTDISLAFETELSEGEYGESFGQSRLTTRKGRGKEIANQIRRDKIRREQSKHNAQFDQNSQSDRHRKHRNAPESSHQSESDCDSSGSVSDNNNKENMAVQTKLQKAAANEARRLQAAAGPTNANENINPDAAETERLAAENTRLKNQVALLAKNTASFEPKSDEVASVVRKVKFVMFTRYQFNIHAADTNRITAKIFMKLHNKQERKDMGIDGKAQWIKTYSPAVKDEMTVTRGYRCQELRKVCLDYAKEHNTLPSLAMMLKCMTGDIDLEDDEELETYTWYWTKCMPVTVMASNWTAPIRNFTLMHQATSRDDDTVRFWPGFFFGFLPIYC